MTPVGPGNGATTTPGNGYDRLWDDLCEQVDLVVASIEELRYRAVVLGIAVVTREGDQAPLLTEELAAATAEHRRAAAVLDQQVGRLVETYRVPEADASLAILAARAPATWRQRLAIGCRTMADATQAAARELASSSRVVAADELHLRQTIGALIGSVDLRDGTTYDPDRVVETTGRLADGRA